MFEKITLAINLLASIFTIAATIIAVITLVTWKKQQLLSSKMDVVLNSEDHYLLLINSYIEVFKFFFDINKLNFDVKDKSNEIKKQAAKIINEERQKLNMDKNALYSSNFHMSVFRLQRMGLISDIEECLDTNHLYKFFSSYLDELSKRDYSSIESNEKFQRQFVVELFALKERGGEIFKSIRQRL